MRRAWLIIFLVLVILAGCDSKPVEYREQVNHLSSTNRSLTIEENDGAVQSKNVIKKLNEDLDGDTHPEDISVILSDNAQDSEIYDLSIRINDTEFTIHKYCNNSMYTDPMYTDLIHLQTIQSSDQVKFLMLSVSFPVNGQGMDGDYRANLFRYTDKKIIPVWDGTYSHSQSNFQYIIDIAQFTLELPEDGIRYTKKFEPESKYSFLMKDRKEREKAGKSIPSIFLTVPVIENLGVKDYDNDGLKEIITQNAVFLEDAHIYIGSLYTLYRPGKLTGRPDKVFMLDRYGISSRIMKEIIDNGYMEKGNWGVTLRYWIETKYKNYTEKDIENSLKELLEQKILVLDNDVYKLFLK